MRCASAAFSHRSSCSASHDPDGTIASYEWLVGTSTVLARGATATLRLPDGLHSLTLRITDNAGGVALDTIEITLVVTDDSGSTGSDAVLIRVLAPPQAMPIANAGADRTIADSDGEPGEDVALDGSGSSDPDGPLASYQWIRNGLQIAAGSNPTVRLPDGASSLTLVVTDGDGNTASDVVEISIGRPAFVAILSALPGLSENQRSVAVALDTLCPRLQARADTLSGDQLDLLRRCNAITLGSTPTEQRRALDQITPEEMNATRTQTLSLSRSQLINVADRLVAFRKGAKGLSLIGLNLSTQDSYIPAEQVASSLQHAFGGGASADEARESLFDDRLGLWLRGNYSFGDKSESQADHGFEADQWAVLSGIDFRFTPTSVVGIALGYGRSQVDFNPVGSGELATSALTGAIYTTMYSEKGFYVDAIAHVNVRSFTIAPSVGYNYMASTIGGFRETGAAGLDLLFKDQTYTSGTANADLRMSYAWKTGLGVVIPQVRGEYIRELIDERETFGVRFANDPFEDTPLMVVKTDVPDRSHWRLTGVRLRAVHAWDLGVHRVSEAREPAVLRLCGYRARIEIRSVVRVTPSPEGEGWA